MATTYYMSGVSLIVQYLTNLGLLAAGGSVNTYVGGSVSTPVATYTDSSGQTVNANPLILNSAARPASTSGAPVAFWVPGGTLVKLVVTDASGNLLVQLDNVPAINDLTGASNALQTLLASAASSNTAGTGPVAGVDLVANAVKSYDVFADVRAANSPVLVTSQTLNIEVQGGTTVGDGMGGFFYWAPTSTATDDSLTVLKPGNLTTLQAGRWLRWYGRGLPFDLVKPTDQVVTSNTVLVNDTFLTAALGVGTYLVQERLLLLGIGGTGQGYKVQTAFSGTAGPVTIGAGVATSNGTPAASAQAIGNGFSESAISTTSGDIVTADFVLVVTVAGQLTVTFAQNSSSANSTVMKTGSLLRITRVA